MLKKLLKKVSRNQKRKRLCYQDSFAFSFNEEASFRDYSLTAEKAYVKNVIANRAISIVAVAASSVQINLFQSISKEKKRRLSSHPLVELLNEPNPVMSRITFTKSLIAYKMIDGNAYILRIGNKIPKELHILRPDRVSVIPGDDCLPDGYLYKIGNHKKKYTVNKLTGDCEILHLKNFNPVDDWYGLSNVEAARYSIEQHNQASIWNQSMLKNGARPSGALVFNSKTEQTLSEEQYMRLKEQINENYMGQKNAGRPILLEGGIDWKEMSISPREMDFLNSKYNAAREIALAFGVPPQLLGIPGDNTYSNYEQARLSLWEETILPTLDCIIESLNTWLVPLFGNDLSLEYDKDSIEILTQKREKVWDYVEKASFLTKNEKRQIFGYPPIKE